MAFDNTLKLFWLQNIIIQVGVSYGCLYVFQALSSLQGIVLLFK